jgi:transposase
MAKLSLIDKLRIQTLREQGLGAKAIRSRYPAQNWSISTVQSICRRVDARGSAIQRKKGSGRPKAARCAENIEKVESLICSQEDQPGTHKSTRQIAAELNIGHMSVWRIAKRDLALSSFRRISGQVLNDATKTKRLKRCKQLLRRITVRKLKRTFFTDEKVFYLDPPANCSTSRLWSAGRKTEVSSERLIRQRAKFSRRVMVSAGVCCSGKGRLHFVPEKTKINAQHYTSQLLPLLTEDCRHLLNDEFVFQQDGAPAHTSKQTQDWLQQNCPEFIGKEEWPPNSPDLNPLDYFVWSAMLEKYQKMLPKPKTIAELKTVLDEIWSSLPQQSIEKAVLAFRKRLQACIQSDGGHFEHLLT